MAQPLELFQEYASSGSSSSEKSQPLTNSPSSEILPLTLPIHVPSGSPSSTSSDRQLDLTALFELTPATAIVTEAEAAGTAPETEPDLPAVAPQPDASLSAAAPRPDVGLRASTTPEPEADLPVAAPQPEGGLSVRAADIGSDLLAPIPSPAAPTANYQIPFDPFRTPTMSRSAFMSSSPGVSSDVEDDSDEQEKKLLQSLEMLRQKRRKNKGECITLQCTKTTNIDLLESAAGRSKIRALPPTPAVSGRRDTTATPTSVPSSTMSSTGVMDTPQVDPSSSSAFPTPTTVSRVFTLGSGCNKKSTLSCLSN